MGDHGFGQPARRHVHLDIPTDTYDADLAYDSDTFTPQRKARPKSIFARIKDRIVDVKQPRRDDSSSSRAQSSEEERSRTAARRHSAYPPGARRPAWEQPSERPPPEFIEVDYHDETDSEPEYTHSRFRTSPEHHQTTRDASMMEALENAIELERRNVRGCKQKLAHASKQANVGSAYLQRIIDELKDHEKMLALATDDLNEAKIRQIRTKRSDLPPRPGSRQRPAMPPRQKSYEPPRPQARRSRSARNMHDQFFDPFDGFSGFPPHADPVTQAFENLHGPHIEHAMPFEPFCEPRRPSMEDPHFRAFAMPTPPHGASPYAQPKRSRYSTGGPPPPPNVPHSFAPAGTNAPNNNNTFTRPIRRTTATVTPPQPPATVLRPDEAKRLFTAYDDKWRSLSPTDPDIPYPARGLHAAGLTARDTIWAPPHIIPAHVGSWSEETVMQANAQAFFLGVVGLAPKYVPNAASGRVEVGFDRSLASGLQVQQLVEVLKREKIRWHSDRLGRRNGGKPGVNEALQRDERARAVFHAVCELMENAQGA
jgi:hypothetical protein